MHECVQVDELQALGRQLELELAVEALPELVVLRVFSLLPQIKFIEQSHKG